MTKIKRRTFLWASAGVSMMNPLLAAITEDKFDMALEILTAATSSGQVNAAALHVRSGATSWTQALGNAKTEDAAFLLGSISKPIAITALMTLYDQGRFRLDDRAKKYLPEFTGEGRDHVTIEHLLTHISGLPDQLPQNAELRAAHAPLSEFVKAALRVPLSFEPGTRYEYSSMAILLAAEIAQRISGVEIKELVNTRVLQPLGMTHSALGMGSFSQADIMQCQVEFGAVESGGGSAESKAWDWNSAYWRELGAPWGGVQASAADVGRFLDAFLHPKGTLFSPEVARLMIRNHNPAGLTPRGLAFDAGMQSHCTACSTQTFGHTGSTGTIAWADPQRDLICVVLTTLPARAVESGHPRQLVSDSIAKTGG